MGASIIFSPPSSLVNRVLFSCRLFCFLRVRGFLLTRPQCHPGVPARVRRAAVRGACLYEQARQVGPGAVLHGEVGRRVAPAVLWQSLQGVGNCSCFFRLPCELNDGGNAKRRGMNASLPVDSIQEVSYGLQSGAFCKKSIASKLSPEHCFAVVSAKKVTPPLFSFLPPPPPSCFLCTIVRLMS